MGVLDLVARAVSKPAGRVVEAPVRDLVDEALRQANLASPQELQAVRVEVSNLTAELHALRNQLRTLTDALEAVRSEAGAAREAARQAAETAGAAAETAGAASAAAARNADALEEASALAARGVEAAQEAAARAERVLAEAPAPEPEPDAEASDETSDDDARRGRRSLSHLGCGVPGCERAHRSRGFCSRHYQQWRRGSLDGFIGPKGLLSHGDTSYRVDPDLQGQPFEAREEGGALIVLVDGAPVDVEAAG
ncbi:MAG: hypothetical protein H6739_00630 [Alphaproteobacteria bacterium]|nr:hypothetical protein [Alphaproteobacteria bacterium]